MKTIPDSAPKTKIFEKIARKVRKKLDKNKRTVIYSLTLHSGNRAGAARSGPEGGRAQQGFLK
jgi:hypothetical protein